jgi:hypothetical protein
VSDKPVTNKPSSGPIGRALIDEPGLDENALDSIVGGTASTADLHGGETDTWSQAVRDHAQVVPARGPVPDQASGAAAAPLPPASEEIVKRVLIITRGGPQPPDTPPTVDLSDPDDQLGSLFDPSKSHKET